MTKTGEWLATWMVEDGAIDRLPEGWDDPHALIQKIEADAALPRRDGDDLGAAEPALDVRRVVQAITNIATRQGLVKDPPVDLSLARIYGWSTTPENMDEMIAREYAALNRRQDEPVKEDAR
jgi:hypothetical protein